MAATTETTLRVVQLNAGSLLEHGWEQRRDEIVAWLVRLDPDVVCLQEIWEKVDDPSTNTAAWLARRIGGAGAHMYFGGGEFDRSLWPDANVAFGSAVLSRWPVEGDTVMLPTEDDPEDRFPSLVPWELVHASTAGLDLYSCHLSSAPQHGHHRRRQVLAIDEYIRATRGDRDGSPNTRRPRTEMPAILCGDFNAEPDSDEIRFLTSLCDLEGRRTYYQDAWRVAGDGGPGWTQQWRTHPIAEALNVPRKRIDYVFVGDPFARVGGAGRILSAELAFHESLTGVMASDHIGLCVDILWPTRPD